MGLVPVAYFDFFTKNTTFLGKPMEIKSMGLVPVAYFNLFTQKTTF